MLDLDPNRPPPPPRDAATVIVLRAGAAPLEVFCVKRHPKSGFLGGAVVFPGGKTDVADRDPSWAARATAPSERARAFADDASLALAVTACRELLEEGALLPVLGDSLDADGAVRLRESIRAGASMQAELERLGLSLDAARLVPWARWITPEAESRRYDTRFYLLVLPPAQTGAHDDHETTTSFWGSPRDVLDRWTRGEIVLAPPTTRTLELLLGVGSIDDALALAARQSLGAICPVLVLDGGEPFLALPGDPRHPITEIRAAGPTRFVLREGRFVSENPPSSTS